MKNLLLFSSLLFLQYTNAQDAQLIENDWYLQELVIEDDVLLPPNANTVARVFFTNELFEMLHTFCEEGFGVEIEYENEDMFTIQDGGNVLLGTCTQPEVIDFGEFHYSIYHTEGQAINPFNYEFDVVDDLLLLTVTNNEGNQAIYANALLSTNTVSFEEVAVLPNPTATYINITGLDTSQIQQIVLYDYMGKKLYTGMETKLNVSEYKNGVYFVTIKTKAGLNLYKKVIKK